MNNHTVGGCVMENWPKINSDGNKVNWEKLPLPTKLMKNTFEGYFEKNFRSSIYKFFKTHKHSQKL